MAHRTLPFGTRVRVTNPRTSAAWKSWSTTADLRPQPDRRPVARLGPPNRHGRRWHRRRRAADRGAAALNKPAVAGPGADGGIYTALVPSATPGVGETMSNSLIQCGTPRVGMYLALPVRSPPHPGYRGKYGVRQSQGCKAVSRIRARCAAGGLRARGVELSGRFRGRCPEASGFDPFGHVWRLHFDSWGIPGLGNGTLDSQARVRRSIFTFGSPACQRVS